MKNRITSIESFVHERQAYFIWIDLIGIAWFLYTTGILSTYLPMTVHQYLSNAIYSALGVLLIAGSSKSRKVLSKRLAAAVLSMLLLNALLEIVPLFTTSNFTSVIERVSTVADPLDFLSGLVGIGLVVIGYYVVRATLSRYK